MNSNYSLTIPLPGGGRVCKIFLREDSGVLTGYILNPYSPDEKCGIYDGTLSGTAFSFKAMVRRTEFVFAGTMKQDSLELTLTTYETIELGPGRRIAGKTGDVCGEFIVGIYSPGGVKENHFVLAESGSGLGGEMFCMFDPNLKLPEGGPGGGTKGGGGPVMEFPGPDALGRVDVNSFISGSRSADSFSVTTKTGQGSLFTFSGKVIGDVIFMTMNVVDTSSPLIAEKI